MNSNKANLSIAFEALDAPGMLCQVMQNDIRRGPGHKVQRSASELHCRAQVPDDDDLCNIQHPIQLLAVLGVEFDTPLATIDPTEVAATMKSATQSAGFTSDYPLLRRPQKNAHQLA
jgi:hypothetical protein